MKIIQFNVLNVFLNFYLLIVMNIIIIFVTINVEMVFLIKMIGAINVMIE